MEKNCKNKSLNFEITDSLEDDYETTVKRRIMKNWLGASISSQLSSFDFISKEEYLEKGYEYCF
jgi:actin-related protein